MAAAQGHSDDGDGAPLVFQRAVGTLRAARVRPEVELAPMPAPRKLAPYACAVEASVLVEGEELADGRLVLLHDPAGQEAWNGTFRVVTLARADLEPEMAADPLLPEVCWSWLTGALAARGAAYCEPSGTVSRSSSHYFGALAERPDSTQIEVRASWTPQDTAAGGPDAAAHLTAWCELLCAGAGLPPSAGAEQGGGVVSLPNRRGPR
ncbi:DUF3000 domain-containing protein [Streptomyces sp. ICBB 8177]|uniref:DUF3000 domain-containing protein n=1 Tax=Streptomyces sp. ICBB 8177 TaxID=563922 RepID=UPI000D67AD47|nr:DUF3000 domain-containing protein [Streptomyces sp. ICBB 8177]PWI41349.1 hypothetical protein CK485_20795 [Streptomyces sp. ICBB 8177]